MVRQEFPNPRFPAGQGEILGLLHDNAVAVEWPEPDVVADTFHVKKL